MSDQTPWADLTSAQRLDAILLVVADARLGEATAGHIAMHMPHPMDLAAYGRHGGGRPTMRRMSTATRVTPGITALRKRGLLDQVPRRDGLSGTADVLTKAGRERVQELRS